MAEPSAPKHSVLDSSFPVLLPYNESLFLPDVDFRIFVQKAVGHGSMPPLDELKMTGIEGVSKDATVLKRPASEETDDRPIKKSPFVAGLEKHEAALRTEEDLAVENKTLTENGDLTNLSSRNPLVDLFHDLSKSTEASVLKALLENAWREDPLMTLKIIFNARSIHLGKSDKIAAYKALGWLAENHPNTLLVNLSWLVRLVIQKKTHNSDTKEVKQETTAIKSPETESNGKTTMEEDDFDMIDADEATTSEPAQAHDVRFGVSHGYWKDLLNLVVFAANDQLKFDGNPGALLSQPSHPKNRDRVWNSQDAKALRKQKEHERFDRVVNKLREDGFYGALHYTVARLFAEQLQVDSKLLKSGKKSDLRKLSLAAKWSPTFGEFHDKQTFILSSIAELLYPDAAEICPDASNRELYLRHARELYRKNYASPLRKALAIVERDIAAQTFENINYEHVPSLAMNRHAPLFIKKDYEHFNGYLEKVAGGDARISGATLFPSILVMEAMKPNLSDKKDFTLGQLLASKKAKLARKVVDGQWKALVQRVKDSGALDSSIAVCDVSGSMTFQKFEDKTTPMDSAIGLSLLVSEITSPPFGGGFITFSNKPTYVSVGGPEDTRDLSEKARYIMNSEWGMNTDLVAVFEKVILPMAKANKLKPGDMVKRVFVFSDMQFDAATNSDRWTSSFDRIKAEYAASGYEMPRLVFWNLAHARTNNPVTNDDQNTALVSGYSQGMLKVFLDGGGFEEEGEEEVEEEELADEDGMTVVKVKRKVDPLTLVKKAVSHKAYSMLEVVD